MAQPVAVADFDPATEPIDERTQVLVGLAPEGNVAVWLLLTYRYTACTVQALWPCPTAPVAVPRHTVADCWWNALDETIMTRIVPVQQLPDSVTDSDHWTTFACLAHNYRFRRLRGQRLLSSTQDNHVSVSLLGTARKARFLTCTGSGLSQLWEDGYDDAVDDLLRHADDAGAEVV